MTVSHTTTNMFLSVTALLALSASGFGQDMEKARLRVFLPAADAKLEIQGKLTERSGTVRLFESPPLPFGKNFLYDLKVSWVENGKTVTLPVRTVRVTAGQTTEVDLRDTKTTEEPKPAPAVVKPLPTPVEPKPPMAAPPEVKPKEPKPAEFKPKEKPPEVKLDVPFVPTPEPIVEEMLKMAKVKEGDVVYDLGCGDGRIVIRAVKNYKAKKGVGIDIDPARIKDSNDAAKAAEVQDKVLFKQGDVLKLTEKDLEEATVVTMYLYPKINDQLAPILKKLKPGTRIVSHDFKITDWAHDETKEMEVENLDHSIYLWIVK